MLLTFYYQDPEEYPEKVPLYERELFLSAVEGVTFSTCWPQCSKKSENVAEKGKDVGDTWTLGIAGSRGLDYIRVKVMNA